MPKGRPKGKAKAKANIQCLTLHEDETTRCANLPTHGERCAIHQGQYSKLYQRYSDASKVVDEVLEGSIIPNQAEISAYTDFSSSLNKARWIRRYVESIRVERIGRELHQKRFFLKGASLLSVRWILQ